MAPEDDEPHVESEYVERIWRALGRARVERDQDGEGTYGVRVGKHWWDWSKDLGAMSNEREPDVQSGVGEEFQALLDPTLILGALRIAVTGRGEVAGRATITAEAQPRRPDEEDSGSFSDSFALHALGTGAERYVLEVDVERGVLLSVEAIRDGLPFARTEAIEIVFDEPVDEDIFVLSPPARRAGSLAAGAFQPPRAHPDRRGAAARSICGGHAKAHAGRLGVVLHLPRTVQDAPLRRQRRPVAQERERTRGREHRSDGGGR